MHHFWGSDIRDRPPEAVAFLRHADAAIVGSFLTRRRAPTGGLAALRGDPAGDRPHELGRRRRREPGPRVRIVHAPSRRAGKGTAGVLDAIETLQREGAPIDLDLIEGVPHAEARQRYAAADLVIDQVRLGWYGLTVDRGDGARQARRLPPRPRGRRRDRRRLRACRCPTCGPTAAALPGVLRELIRDPERLPALGAASRAYAEAVHAHDRVAARVVEVYRQAGIA